MTNLTPPQADLVRAIRRISNSCGSNTAWLRVHADVARRCYDAMVREGRVS